MRYFSLVVIGVLFAYHFSGFPQSYAEQFSLPEFWNGSYLEIDKKDITLKVQDQKILFLKVNSYFRSNAEYGFAMGIIGEIPEGINLYGKKLFMRATIEYDVLRQKYKVLNIAIGDESTNEILLNKDISESSYEPFSSRDMVYLNSLKVIDRYGFDFFEKY